MVFLLTIDEWVIDRYYSLVEKERGKDSKGGLIFGSSLKYGSLFSVSPHIIVLHGDLTVAYVQL